MPTLKALVVDDAAFVRDLVKRTVRSQFPVIELQEAADGRKAQALMSRSHFDLILCDWEMPEMSGLELLRWMRQHDAYRKQPFIMITSRGDKDHVIEAVKEGVSDYLSKPFSPESLGKKIIKVMGPKLKQAMSSGGSRAPAADAFKESANLLTQGQQAPEKPKSAKKGPTAEAGSNKSLGVAAIRFATHTLKCIIKSLTLNEIRVIARRGDEAFPGILEQAAVDIEVAEGQMARLNGYVQQLQAVEKRQDTDFVSITVRFVDEDPQKLEDLSRFIARLNG
ncbi:response regulator [Marinobacteraceae bacterium S3BR75-40.1]